MNIVYLMDYDINTTSGVVQKINQQVVQWVAKGHSVYVVSLKTMTVYDGCKNIIYTMKPLKMNFGKIGTAFNLLYNSYFVYKLFDKIDVDIIYMRYRLFMPFFNKILKDNKVIMEINSDDLQEYKLNSRLTHYYNILTRRFLLSQVNAFVCVSKELKKKFSYLQKPICVIANGINTEEYDVEFVKNEKPKFVFIGTPKQPWHGLDKILKMAASFQQYQFYIIGTEGTDTQNIRYLGYLSQVESTKIIKKCDIGIGTLSLYKKGLKEASPLKTRQYVACGVPILYAYEDTDIQENLPFALKLENNDNNIDIQKIEDFVQIVFQNSAIRSRARKFAEEKLDYNIKEKKRLDFFKRIMYEK